MKASEDAAWWDEGAERTRPSLQNFDSSAAKRREGVMGEKGKERRRLREIKGALIKGLSLFPSDRGEGVVEEGFNEKSMMIRTDAVEC